MCEEAGREMGEGRGGGGGRQTLTVRQSTYNYCDFFNDEICLLQSLDNGLSAYFAMKLGLIHICS